MAQRKHLKNAPVTEALVDLRATPTADLTKADVSKRLKEALSEKYPKNKESRAFQAQLEIRHGQLPVPTASDQGLHGYFFESPEGRDIAQFRVDGFTYNRLKPYTDGDAVIDEALRLWSLYDEVAKPLTVSRVALRYINTIKLSDPLDTLSRYLTLVPTAPEGSPGAIVSFLSRVETLDADSGFRVITTQALRPGMPAESINVVLDIDAFCLRDLGVTPDELRLILRELRKLKNAVFFGSITEKAVEIFA